MGQRSRRKSYAWPVQPLAPLMEGPVPEVHGEGEKKERYWETFRTWARARLDAGSSGSHSLIPVHKNGNIKEDLRLILGVLACPLAPIPLTSELNHHLAIKDFPIETSSARYIVQQYLAATGCLKLNKDMKNMYVAGSLRMTCCESDNSLGRAKTRNGGGEEGCFVLWQMSPGIWLMEMAAAEYKVAAGSNGKIVWRNLPWIGTSEAKGPQRPLRRTIQGLDPRCTANMFAKARCLGEKQIGEENCFVLKVTADAATIAERSEGPAEVIRHVLYGYFSQKSGLLIYIEDSHLARVQPPGCDTIYWETTIGSIIQDYKEVDGVLIAHQGRTVATVLRFGNASSQHSQTRMEEVWRIEDIEFNVPGLSVDCFIPPKDTIVNTKGKTASEPSYFTR